MNCLHTMETDEVNPLIATLEILDDTAGCICAVPDLDAAGRRLHDVECGLQVTRCITPQNITVLITSSTYCSIAIVSIVTMLHTQE